MVQKTKERIRLAINIYPKVFVSFSGGKDSTVLCELVRQVCQEDDREFTSIFNDIETIAPEITDFVLSKKDRFNVDILQANVKYKGSDGLVDWVNWDPDHEDLWCKPRIGIQPDVKLSSWFNLFTDYAKFKSDGLPFCNFIGIRSQESFHRNMTTTRTKKNNAITWMYDHVGYAKAYPLFDWTWQDVWDYIVENNLGYNKCYDYWTDSNIRHSKSRTGSLYSAAKGQSKTRWTALFTFEKYNPDFYNKIVKRMEALGVDIEQIKKDH